MASPELRCCLIYMSLTLTPSPMSDAQWMLYYHQLKERRENTVKQQWHNLHLFSPLCCQSMGKWDERQECS